MTNCEQKTHNVITDNRDNEAYRNFNPVNINKSNKNE